MANEYLCSITMPIAVQSFVCQWRVFHFFEYVLACNSRPLLHGARRGGKHPLEHLIKDNYVSEQFFAIFLDRVFLT